MSVLELSAFNGNEATDAQDYQTGHAIPRAGPDYGDLVTRLIEQREVTAGEAKRIIAEDGRHTVLLEVQQ